MSYSWQVSQEAGAELHIARVQYIGRDKITRQNQNEVRFGLLTWVLVFPSNTPLSLPLAGRPQVVQTDAAANYPVGPPYLMHPRDWARVLDLWVALSPKVYKGHEGILAEMYGFCIAAAHLQ